MPKSRIPLLGLALGVGAACCGSVAGNQESPADAVLRMIAPANRLAITPEDSGIGSVPTASLQVLAQGSCAAVIASCNTISTNKRCHDTEKLVYTKSGSLWCKTPVPCSCP